MLIKLTYDVTRAVKRIVKNLNKTPLERYLEQSVDHADFQRRMSEWERTQYRYSSNLGRMPYWNH